LLRFATTHDDKQEQRVTLEDYVSRMKEGQDSIYYVIAESHTAAKNSPHLEIFRKKGIEVLLLTDRVDEWLMSYLTEFDGKKLKSVAKGDVELDDKPKDDKEKEQVEKEEKAKEQKFESVIKNMQEVLKDQVQEVRLSNRLTDSPACIVVADQDMSLHLQRLMAQAGQDMGFGASKPTLEINPDHALVKRLETLSQGDELSDWTHILFDQAMLAEGGKLQDPATFVKRMNKYLAS